MSDFWITISLSQNQRDVELLSFELDGDNNLNLIENNAIYNILDQIGDD